MVLQLLVYVVQCFRCIKFFICMCVVLWSVLFATLIMCRCADCSELIGYDTDIPVPSFPICTAAITVQQAAAVIKKSCFLFPKQKSRGFVFNEQSLSDFNKEIQDILLQRLNDNQSCLNSGGKLPCPYNEFGEVIWVEMSVQEFN